MLFLETCPKADSRNSAGAVIGLVLLERHEAAGRPLEVSVINRSTGKRLQTFHHGGKLYVAGNPGDRYSVALNNCSRGRLLAVISVDGVNVLTGETASPAQ